MVEFVNRHDPVMMEISAIFLLEHQQHLFTINVSEVAYQHALHRSPNQLEVVLVMKEDEEVAMTVVMVLFLSITQMNQRSRQLILKRMTSGM